MSKVQRNSSVAMVLCFLAWAASPSYAASPAGQVYDVTVITLSTGGEQTDDVFRFDEESVFISREFGIGEYIVTELGIVAIFDAGATNLTLQTVNFSGVTFFFNGSNLIAFGRSEDGTSSYLVFGTGSPSNPPPITTPAPAARTGAAGRR